MIDGLTEEDAKTTQRMFFIDSENGMTTLMEGFESLSPKDVIVVFHRNTVPRKTRESLEMGPAAVEWIGCVDPGVKNSMDVQIISELSMRCSQGVFKEGYLISCDKGYLPAIHYLQKSSSANGRTIEQAKNIELALHHSVMNMFSNIENLECREDVIQSLSLFLGAKKAERVVEKLSEILAPAENETAQVASAEIQPEKGRILEFALLGQSNEDEGKLTDLKGIGVGLSVKLKNAGVTSASKLRQLGAVEAWRRIREQEPGFSMKWIYVFEAAITDSALGGICTERKQELKRQAKLKVS